MLAKGRNLKPVHDRDARPKAIACLKKVLKTFQKFTQFKVDVFCDLCKTKIGAHRSGALLFHYRINCTLFSGSIYRNTKCDCYMQFFGVHYRYVSCVLGCPYEGDISAEKVAQVNTQNKSILESDLSCI